MASEGKGEPEVARAEVHSRLKTVARCWRLSTGANIQRAVLRTVVRNARGPVKRSALNLKRKTAVNVAQPRGGSNVTRR